MSLLFGQLRRGRLLCRRSVRAKSSQSTSTTREHGILPSRRWSVEELLASYPKPQLSYETLDHLHDLAALKPPPRGSEEYAKLKNGMEDLVKLVEAVRLVDTEGVEPAGWCERPEYHGPPTDGLPVREEKTGRDLMKHASRVEGEFYVVENRNQR